MVLRHILQQQRRGPRYDPSLTPEQRSSIDNGIWMCRSHGALIDSDYTIYSVEQLKNWKQLAETQQSLLLQMTHRESEQLLRKRRRCFKSHY